MKYKVMKLLEFVNHFDIEVQMYEAGARRIDAAMCREAINRLDEMIGWIDEIEEITKRTYK